MANELAVEAGTYRVLLSQLLAHEGKFVLITGERLLGTFDTYADALEIGYRECGLSPFLVKKISAGESVVNFSRDIKGTRVAL